MLHLETVFQRLSESGLVINVDKCIFALPEIIFLGHMVNSKGILPSPERVRVIEQFAQPSTVQQLKRFLGMINFYRRFIPAAAQDQAILNDFLKGYRKNSKILIEWSENSIKAFEECKRKLCETTLLAHPLISAQLSVMVDASDIAIGAVIQQRVEDIWQPLSFFSIRLTQTQQKYSAYDRELLAAYLGIKHFRFYLEARNFTLYTDHKPLVFAFKQNLDKASPRQRRQLDYIGQFTTDLQHVSGIDNVVADMLSRVEQINVHESIDYEKLADTQAEDEELLNLVQNEESKLKFEKVQTSFNSKKSLYCDNSTGKSRPFIPISWRKEVFNTFHGLSHPGVKATVKLLTDHVVWPSIKKDVKIMAQSCIACQKSKIGKHTKSTTGTYNPTTERFTEIHLDIVGPLPPSNGQKYCITMIDRYTRWAEAIPVPDITAATVAFTVFSAWIARSGVPKFIVTDQGAQFESQLFSELSALLGFERKRTTSYNPKCNGMIERWHRTLKAAIMCHNRLDWTDILPSILLGLRTTYREELQSTSAELVYGSTLRIPGQFVENKIITTPQTDFVKNLKNHFNELRPETATRHAQDKIFISPTLNICSHVFVRTDAVRKSLESPYTGPYVVLSRGDKFFDIERKNKRVSISIDRLKPCYTENEEQITLPQSSKSETSQIEEENKNFPVKINTPSKAVTFQNQQEESTTTTRTGRTTRVPSRYR